MRSKNATATLIIILVVLFYAALRWYVLEAGRKEAFDRRPRQLIYTRHALCRMDCGHISRDDIDEIMKRGIIFLNKSDRNAKPCPIYALQGYTRGHENIRVIFAQCDGSTRVVTCYNLHKNFDCFCPGDPDSSFSEQGY